VSPADSVPENLDSVLRKYGKIWIWSILSAAIAALSMRSFAGVTAVQFAGLPVPRGGSAASTSVPLLAFAYLASPLATVAALYYLLQFLRHHLLPILFPKPAARSESFTLTGAPAAGGAAGPESSVAVVSDSVPDGAQLLFRAFVAIVIGVAAEPAVLLAALLYRAIASSV
jgi:hypothetical protein